MVIRACLFDVFGTCVDWRQSVEEMLREQFLFKGIDVKASFISGFATAWRAGYSEYNSKVAKGEISEDAFETIDVVHRRVLINLLALHRIKHWWSTSEIDSMNMVWHRLKPWSDTVAGIKSLKEQFIVGTLSNGNIRLLVDMAKAGGLEWDVLLSSELYKSAKGNPKVYLGGCRMLDLHPEEVVLVACHFEDLEAAAKCGLRTAFIRRPGEADNRDPRQLSYVEFVVDTIGDLTRQISSDSTS